MEFFEKYCVHRSATTKKNMIERITIACWNISRNVPLSTVDSFQRQIQLCIDNNGCVFEHLIRWRNFIFIKTQLATQQQT